MDDPVHTLMLDMPDAAAIWLLLVACSVLALIAMVGRTGWDRTRTALRNRPPRRRVRLAAEARELTRYAEEVAVAAQRAAVTARRERERWLAAQSAVENAWRALAAADTAACRLAAAAVFRSPATPRTPAEYAARERHLHRAALAACARQELSIYQLSDALAHRNGWDPRLHPAEQEVVLSRAVRDHLAAVHAAAAERERAAWHHAQTAAAAASSLHTEAMAAAWRARRLRPWLQPEPNAAVRVGIAHRPALNWQTARPA